MPAARKSVDGGVPGGSASELLSAFNWAGAMRGECLADRVRADCPVASWVVKWW